MFGIGVIISIRACSRLWINEFIASVQSEDVLRCDLRSRNVRCRVVSDIRCDVFPKFRPRDSRLPYGKRAQFSSSI